MADAIDLSHFTKTADFKVEDSAAAAFNAKNIEQFRFPLPKAIAKGTEIIVNLKVKNNGKSGFRCWTVADDVWTATSEQITSYARQNLPSGTFDLTIKLVPTDTAKYLLIKAPAYGEKIDDIDFTAVTFAIGGKEYSVDPSAEVITT